MRHYSKCLYNTVKAFYNCLYSIRKMSLQGIFVVVLLLLLHYALATFTASRARKNNKKMGCWSSGAAGHRAPPPPRGLAPAHVSLRRLTARHGPDLLLWLGAVPMLVASSPRASRRGHPAHARSRVRFTASHGAAG
ncbi:hypothetical protein EE612_055468 [Oryza sativa]|nr:hypothetical protein EE612_055468 [Oryza sativa]